MNKPRDTVEQAAWAIPVFTAALLFVWPVLEQNRLPFGSDVNFVTQSAAGFRDALSEGVIYPRWIDSASHGLGSLTFIYYPPLPYYAAALTSFVTDDLVAAFEVVLLMATALSGWGLYALVASFASRSAAAAAAQAYFLAPYRAIDLYDRFAFAEFVAFIWPPLVVLGLRRILVDDRRRGDLARSALLANLRKPGLARDD